MRMGLWSPDEDDKLRQYIMKYGPRCWKEVPEKAGLMRCGKSCRLRWINYLKPDLKLGKFSADEIRRVVELHRIVGNRWSQIAAYMPGRTDNQIKNVWHSRIKRQLQRKSNQVINGIVESMAEKTHQELAASSEGGTVVLSGCPQKSNSETQAGIALLIDGSLSNRSLELGCISLKEGNGKLQDGISSSRRSQLELDNALLLLRKSSVVKNCHFSPPDTRFPEGLDQIVWRFLSPSSASIGHPIDLPTAGDDTSEGGADLTDLIRSETAKFSPDSSTERPEMQISPFSVDSLESYQMRDLRRHGFDEAADSQTEMEVMGSYETSSSSSATIGSNLACWPADHSVDPCSNGYGYGYLHGMERACVRDHGCGYTQEMPPVQSDHMFAFQHRNCYPQGLPPLKSDHMVNKVEEEEGEFVVQVAKHEPCNPPSFPSGHDILFLHHHNPLPTLPPLFLHP